MTRSDEISNLDSHLFASRTSINFSDNKDTFHRTSLDLSALTTKTKSQVEFESET